MLYILNKKAKKENLEEIKKVVNGREIITDPSNLKFFLNNFKGKQIYVVSKTVQYINHVTTILDSDYFIKEYEHSKKEFVICGTENLKHIFIDNVSKFF